MLSVLGQQLIIGLTNGMLFALVALGYSLVYGVLGLINLAHGDVFMLSTFMALTLFGLLPVGCCGIYVDAGCIVLVLAVCASFAAGLNMGLERCVFRFLRSGPKLASLVSAIGLSLIMQNLGLFWGGLPMAVFAGGRAAAAPKSFPDLIPEFDVLGAGASWHLTSKDAMVIGTSILTMAALLYIVHGTRMGRAMRACAQDPTAARLMGVPVDRIVAATFALGGALAGIAGVIYGLYFNTTHYQVGYQNGLYAYTAAVLGGIGSVAGALLGGLLIGIVRALSDQFVGAQWQSAVVFALLIAVLILRPAGLLGHSAQEKV